MPAEIGYVEAQGETGLEQALSLLHFVGFVIYVNSNHNKYRLRLRLRLRKIRSGS
jgi:hypothetical protein